MLLEELHCNGTNAIPHITSTGAPWTFTCSRHTMGELIHGFHIKFAKGGDIEAYLDGVRLILIISYVFPAPLYHTNLPKVGTLRSLGQS